eukprot:1200923-Amphidinium_carterae.1
MGQLFLGASARYHGAFSSHAVVSVTLSDDVAIDSSGWRLVPPMRTPASAWGVPDSFDMEAHDWWHWQSAQCVSEDPQVLYDYWLQLLNQWLRTTEQECTKGTCPRGSLRSRYHAAHGKKSQKQVCCDVWSVHVLKKALSYATEVQGHSVSGCDSCGRCRLLMDKFSRLPLRSLEIVNCRLSLENSVEVAVELRAALDSASESQTAGLSRWKISMEDSALRCTAAVYDWLRHGADSIAVVVHNSLHHVHPPHILAALGDYWHRVLVSPDSKVDSATIDSACAIIGYHPLV